MNDTVKDRFFNLLAIDPESGCWMWKGYRKTKSAQYGWFWFNGKYEYAHRMAWRIFRGEIPKGLFVCHHCDTPGCVNPEHLFIGSQLDNMRDASNKNRFIGTRRRRIFSESEIFAIRKGPGTYEELSERYHVNKQTIWRIKKGKIYKEIVD